MICEKCGKEYFEDFRKDPKQRKKPSRFCSVSCSRSRPKSEASKSKVSETLRRKYNENKRKKRPKSLKVQKLCRNCGTSFSGFACKVYCSKECSREGRSKDSIRISRERRRKLKKKLIEYMGGSCRRCGFNEHPAALHFHHETPGFKDFNVSEGTHSLKKVLKEAAKCILLCANCHAIVHNEEPVAPA